MKITLETIPRTNQ